MSPVCEFTRPATPRFYLIIVAHLWCPICCSSIGHHNLARHGVVLEWAGGERIADADRSSWCTCASLYARPKPSRVGPTGMPTQLGQQIATTCRSQSYSTGARSHFMKCPTANGYQHRKTGPVFATWLQTANAAL